MSYKNRIEFKNVDEAVAVLGKLTPNDVTFLPPREGSSKCKFYGINFNINGTPSTFVVKFNNVDIKFNPQKVTQNGPEKVKCSFFKNECSLGTLFDILEKLVIPKLREKFKENVYPSLVGLIQSMAKEMSKEGEDNYVDIKKPLGRITMPYRTRPTSNKQCYAGRITTISGTGKAETHECPKFEDITKFWPSRAYVTGYLVLDNILVLSDRRIFFTASFDVYQPLTILPIVYKMKDNTDDITELRKFAIENNITIESEVIENNTEVENVNKVYDTTDFDEEPI